MKSKSGNYSMKLALVGGRYSGQIRRDGYYECDGSPLDATGNIRVTPRKSALVGDEWVVTVAEAIMVYDSIGESTCLPAHSRSVVTLKRNVR